MRCRVAWEYVRRVVAAAEFVSDAACKRPAERGLLVLVLVIEEENADTTRGVDRADDVSILVVVFVIVVEVSIISITLMAAATQNSTNINTAARLGIRRICLRGLDRVLVHVFLFLLVFLLLLQLLFLLLTILSPIR